MKQPVFGAKCVFVLEFTLAQYMILAVLVKIQSLVEAYCIEVQTN